MKTKCTRVLEHMPFFEDDLITGRVVASIADGSVLCALVNNVFQYYIKNISLLVRCLLSTHLKHMGEDALWV